MKPFTTRIALLFIGISLSGDFSGHAETVTWTNTAGGNWSEASNWSPNRLPDSGDKAVLPGLGTNTYAVTLDVPASVSSLIVGATSGSATQTFSTGEQYLDVHGVLQVNSQGTFLLNGGTLAGTNVLEGRLNWIYGTLGGIITVSKTGVLNIDSGGGQVEFSSTTLTNLGSVIWYNSTLYNFYGNGTQIYNYGLWNEQGDDYFDGDYYASAGTVFNNFGTLLKSANPGTTVFDASITFNNTGTVEAESGTLVINGEGRSASPGTFVAGDGGEIEFGGDYDFAGGTSFSGAGGVYLTGGSPTVAGSIKGTNLCVTGATLAGTNALVGTFTLDGGVISGSHLLEGTLNWTAGSVEGAFTVGKTGVLNIASSGGGVDFVSATFTNLGTVNWTNTPIYNYEGVGTKIFNYGSWNERGEDYFDGDYYALSGTVFNNFGTLLKSGNQGTTVLDASVTLNNTGTVEAESGTLVVYGGGVSAGPGAFVAGSGQVIQLEGDYVISNGTTFGGAGSVLLSSGTPTLAGPIKGTNLYLAGATLAGTNVLSGTLNWTAGYIEGLMTISSNGVLNITGGGQASFASAILTNYGTVNWTNTTIQNYEGTGTQIFNYGLWNERGEDYFNGDYYASSGTVFDNFGTFRKSGNSGTTVLDASVTLNNTGTVDVQSGSLILDSYNLGGGTLNFGISSLTNFGVINLQGNAALTGTISANLNGKYIPIFTNAFQVLNFSSFSGGFTNTNLPPRELWQTIYNPANVTIQLLRGVEKTFPSVTITSPKANSRSDAPVFGGTASDADGVVSVAYWVTNVNNGVISIFNGPAVLAAGSGSVSNWSIPTALQQLRPGTNILAVQSTNDSGVASPVATATFFYQQPMALQLQIYPPGMGSVTGVASASGDPAPPSQTTLYVGEAYTLTAHPANNWLLTNWTTHYVVAGSNNSLTFIMEPYLTVTANFATNLFIGMAGRYDGIFSPPDSQGPSETNSGLIENLRLGTNGVYSGKLYLSGTANSLSGTFNTSGQTTEPLGKITTAGGNVTLQLNVLFQGPPRMITGMVEGNGWVSSNLSLVAATTNLNNSSNYTVLLAQDPYQAGRSPSSYGYALVTNSGSMIYFGGVLSDGTPFSRSEPINEQNEFPVYANLYGNAGLLLGPWSLSAGIFGAVPSGDLAWIKPAQSSGLYTNGFDAALAVEGSPWTNSEPALAGLFPDGAQLTFTGGDLPSQLQGVVQLTSSDALRLVTNSADISGGSINPANGLMTVTFTNASGKQVTAHGAVLQNLDLGGGFFPGTTNAGTISLTPQTAPGNESDTGAPRYLSAPWQKMSDAVAHDQSHRAKIAK